MDGKTKKNCKNPRMFNKLEEFIKAQEQDMSEIGSEGGRIRERD